MGAIGDNTLGGNATQKDLVLHPVLPCRCVNEYVQVYTRTLIQPAPGAHYI